MAGCQSNVGRFRQPDAHSALAVTLCVDSAEIDGRGREVPGEPLKQLSQLGPRDALQWMR